MPKGIYSRPSSVQRLIKKTHFDKKSGCWFWQGETTPSGFPLLYHEGNAIRADRFTFNLIHGSEIATAKLTPIKTCGHNNCLNPSHMQLVSNGELAWNAKKTHCKYGHEFTKHNTYFEGPKKLRKCKTCNTLRNRARRGNVKTNTKEIASSHLPGRGENQPSHNR